MAKTAHLAPYYGIAYTRKELIRQIAARGLTFQPNHQKLRFVRVLLEEEPTCPHPR